VKIALALNAEKEFEQLFPAPMAETLNEWIGEASGSGYGNHEIQAGH